MKSADIIVDKAFTKTKAKHLRSFFLPKNKRSVIAGEFQTIVFWGYGYNDGVDEQCRSIQIHGC
jgi:hypothetical protein